MPHMMPMMWMFTLISSLTILFFIMSMIYFFYIPLLYSSNNKLFFSMKNKSNWIWKW